MQFGLFFSNMHFEIAEYRRGELEVCDSEHVFW